MFKRKEIEKSETHKEFEKIVDRELNEYSLSVEWTTGGVTGGNCWGGEANVPVEPEAEPDLEILDEILEKICPEINVFLYKRLCKKVITEDKYTDNQYYGNCYYKKKKTLNLDALYEFLNEHNLWKK